MSKPWFLKLALEAEPTPLAGRIASILSSKPDAHVNGLDNSNGVPNGKATAI